MPLVEKISTLPYKYHTMYKLSYEEQLNRFGHPYIYNVLDWSSSDPTKNAVTVVGTLILSVAIHLVLFGVCKLRGFIYRKCVRTDKKAISLTTTTSTTAATATPSSKISMVLGSYEYNNNAFSGSTEKI